MGRNVNPSQMAKINHQMAKMIDPRVLQQMGKQTAIEYSFVQTCTSLTNQIAVAMLNTYFLWQCNIRDKIQ